jgi:hypothetical protein
VWSQMRVFLYVSAFFWLYLAVFHTGTSVFLKKRCYEMCPKVQYVFIKLIITQLHEEQCMTVRCEFCQVG